MTLSGPHSIKVDIICSHWKGQPLVAVGAVTVLQLSRGPCLPEQALAAGHCDQPQAMATDVDLGLPSRLLTGAGAPAWGPVPWILLRAPHSGPVTTVLPRVVGTRWDLPSGQGGTSGERVRAAGPSGFASGKRRLQAQSGLQSCWPLVASRCMDEIFTLKCSREGWGPSWLRQGAMLFGATLALGPSE